MDKPSESPPGNSYGIRSCRSNDRSLELFPLSSDPTLPRLEFTGLSVLPKNKAVSRGNQGFLDSCGNQKINQSIDKKHASNKIHSNTERNTGNDPDPAQRKFRSRFLVRGLRRRHRLAKCSGNLVCLRFLGTRDLSSGRSRLGTFPGNSGPPTADLRKIAGP